MLKLFSTKNKKFLKTVHKSEAELNKFLSDNWKQFFPQYTFIKDEFPLEGIVRSRGSSGRMDILAFNPKTNKFVVFELKRDLDKNIRNQASDYRDFIEENFADIYLLATQIHSVELPKHALISKDSIEVVLMSKAFAKNDEEKARKSKNEITLIRYFWFENELLVIDYLNNDPDESLQKEIINKKSISTERNSESGFGKPKALSLIEKGKLYKKEFDSGKTVREIANKYGYTTVHIKDCLRLIKAPSEILDAVNKNEMIQSAAAALVSKEINPKKQLSIFNSIMKGKKSNKAISTSDVGNFFKGKQKKKLVNHHWVWVTKKN